MKPGGIGVPEKGQRETRGRSNQTTRETHNAGDGRGIFFPRTGTVSFWGTGPKCRMLQEGCSSCSEHSPMPLCHPWWGEKSSHTDITGSFLERVDRAESSKEPDPSGVSETIACPLSSPADDPSASSAISHLLPLLQSATFLLLHSMPTLTLYYCALQGTIRLKCLFLCICFVCIFWVKRIINLL